MCLRDKEEACHKWMRFYMCNNLCWGISLKLSGTRPFSLLHRKVIRPITSSSHVAHMEQGFWVLLSLRFAVGLECLSYTLVNLLYTYWTKVDQMCSKNNAQIIQIWIILGDILTAEPVFLFFFFYEPMHLPNGHLFHATVNSSDIWLCVTVHVAGGSTFLQWR